VPGASFHLLSAAWPLPNVSWEPDQMRGSIAVGRLTLDVPLLDALQIYPSANIRHLANCNHLPFGSLSGKPVFRLCILQNSVETVDLPEDHPFSGYTTDPDMSVAQLLSTFYCTQFVQEQFQGYIHNSLLGVLDANDVSSSLVHFVIIAVGKDNSKAELPMIVAAASAFVHAPRCVYLKWLAVSAGHMGQFFGPMADGLAFRNRELGTFLVAAVQAFSLSAVIGRDIVPAMTVEVEVSSSAVDFYTRNGFVRVPDDRVSRTIANAYTAFVLPDMDKVVWLKLSTPVLTDNPANIQLDNSTDLSWLEIFADYKLAPISTDFLSPFLRDVISLVAVGPPANVAQKTAAKRLFRNSLKAYQTERAVYLDLVGPLRAAGSLQEAALEEIPSFPSRRATQAELRDMLQSQFEVVDHGSGRGPEDNDCMYQAFLHAATPYAEDHYPEYGAAHSRRSVQPPTSAQRVRPLVAKLVLLASRLPPEHLWWETFVAMITGLLDDDVITAVATKREESFVTRGYRGLFVPNLDDDYVVPEQCLEVFRFTSPPPIVYDVADVDLDHRNTLLAYSTYVAGAEHYKGDLLFTLLATVYNCNICVLSAELGDSGWYFSCAAYVPIPFMLDQATGTANPCTQPPFDSLDCTLETVVLLQETTSDGQKHFLGLTTKQECSLIGKEGCTNRTRLVPKKERTEHLVACLVCRRKLHYRCCSVWSMGDDHGRIKLLKSPHYGAGLLVCPTCNDLRFSDIAGVTGPALEVERSLSLQAAAASLQLVSFEDLRKEQEETKKCAAERRLEIERWENTQSEANLGQADDDSDGGSALANGHDADDHPKSSEECCEEEIEENEDPPTGKDSEDEDGTEEQSTGKDSDDEEENKEQIGGKETEDEEENENPTRGKDSEDEDGKDEEENEDAKEDSDDEEENKDSGDEDSEDEEDEEGDVGEAEEATMDYDEEHFPDDVDSDPENVATSWVPVEQMVLVEAKIYRKKYSVRWRRRKDPSNYSGEWWNDVDDDWLLTLLDNWNTGQVRSHQLCLSDFKEKRIFTWIPHTPIPYLHYPGFLYSIRCKQLGDGHRRQDIYEGLRYNGSGNQLSTTTCPRWWVEKTFSIHFLKKLREQYEAEGNNSEKYTKCPAGEAKELSTLPSNLAPNSDAPPAIFQQGLLDVCALCSLGNLLHAMKCAEGWATLMRIKENFADGVGDSPLSIPDENWLKGFISTEDSLKKAYQPRNIQKNYKLLFPLPKPGAPKGKEAVLSKDKRKQYIPMHDRDKFGGKETPTPPDFGTMKAVSDTEGITWEDYNTPMVLVLRGDDNNTSHSVATWRGWLYDSNVPRALRLNRESLDWCSGGKFLSADRGYQVIPIVRTHPLRKHKRGNKEAVGRGEDKKKKIYVGSQDGNK
jgi:hypothetical protein